MLVDQAAKVVREFPKTQISVHPSLCTKSELNHLHFKSSQASTLLAVALQSPFLSDYKTATQYVPHSLVPQIKQSISIDYASVTNPTE